MKINHNCKILFFLLLSILLNIEVLAQNGFQKRSNGNNPMNNKNIGDNAKPYLVDLDNDGDFDMVLGEKTGVIFYYQNTGSKTSASFGARTGANNPFNGIDVGAYAAPTFADLDGDEDFDLICTEGGGSEGINYFENTGDKTAPSFSSTIIATDVFDTLSFENTATGTGTQQLATEFYDLDNDDDLDMILGLSNGQFSYYENIGDVNNPQFQIRTGDDNPFNGFDIGANARPAIADMDGDGDYDMIAIGRNSGHVGYFENMGTISSPLFYEHSTADLKLSSVVEYTYGHTGTIADMDNDGDIDMYVTSLDASGEVMYYRSSGMPSPEINVTGNGSNITSGSSSISTSNNTDFGTFCIGIGGITQDFVIQNTDGTDILENFISLSDDVNFSITTGTEMSIGSSSTGTLTISFDPQTTGNHTCTVTILNNDDNEGTYTFDIGGTAISTPTFTVSGNGTTIADEDDTPNSSDDTHFGEVYTQTNTFTFSNTTSSCDITINAIYFGEGSVFSSATTTPITVSGSSSETFDVTFTANTVATVTDTVFVETAGETIWFIVEADGVLPGINLQGNSSDIENGQTNTNSGTHTDMFNIGVVSETKTRTYTIQNTSSVSTIDVSSIALAFGSEFNVSSSTTGSIAPGASVTFDITGDPTAVGEHIDTVIVTSDDLINPRYTFVVRAYGAYGEADLTGNGTAIADGNTAISTGDFTDFGSTTIYTSSSNTFVFENTNGSRQLPMSNIYMADGTNFSINWTSTTLLGTNSSTSFEVTFTPIRGGSLTDTVYIVSSDEDEGDYTFVVGGYSEGGEAFATASDGSTELTDGQTSISSSNGTFVGYIEVGQTSSQTFYLFNSDPTYNLYIDSIIVADGIVFSIPDSKGEVITPGSSIALNVSFTPTTSSLIRDTVKIYCSDADESEYTFTIGGLGQYGQAQVKGINGGDVDPDAFSGNVNKGTNFENIDVINGSDTHTFTLENYNSYANLYLTSIALSENTAFSLNYTATNAVAADGSITFDITFDPSDNITYYDTITILSNDETDSIYKFLVTGTGIYGEIGISGNSTDIVDGAIATSTTDNTDFEYLSVTSGSKTNTYVVSNSSSDATTIVSSISSVYNTNFTVNWSSDDDTLLAGENFSFDVTFDPSSEGVLYDTIKIISNDEDEGTYTFVVNGEGKFGEIRISDDSNNNVIDTGETEISEELGTLYSTFEYNNYGTDANVFQLKNKDSDVILYVSSITVSDPTNFTITNIPSSVAVNGTETFTITYNPTTAGTHNCTVTIISDDSDEGTTTFEIRGIAKKESFINNGANVNIRGALYINSSNFQFKNDGTWIDSAGVFTFSGDRDTEFSTIEGSGTTTFNKFNIDVDTLTLAKDITVLGTLSLNSGKMNLSSFVLDLDTTGAISGETETSFIYATTGYIQYQKYLNAPSAYSFGNIGLTLTSSANLGLTTVKRGYEALNVDGEISINRYFDISPTNNSGLDATIVFSYFDEELNGNTEDALQLQRYSSSVWTTRGGTVDATNNTVSLSNIDAFSIWTISGSIILPVILYDYRIECVNGKNELNWITVSEKNSSHFSIETSDDFSTWTTVQAVESVGNSHYEETYHWRDNRNSSEYYRITQYDFDGKKTVFNILNNGCQLDNLVEIMFFPNPTLDILYFQSTTENNIIINIYNNFQQLVHHEITDEQNGEIDMSSLKAGTYTIVVTDNITSQTIKIIKL